ncbi:MAG: 50S ribosomal protein L13 [Dehalococcoidales bacterium]|nr:50S ribosomal protein L13 [Dehalococcoidales bacterium]
MKTITVKASDIKREWHTIDASDEVLGKLANRAANLLMGKQKPLFSRNADVGDFVVVTNAAKIQITGNKLGQKLYYSHSGYPHGLKSITLEKQMATHPERVIEHAVKGMLPKNHLAAKMMKRLRVYTGEARPSTVKSKTVTVAAAKPEAEQKS